MLHRANTVSRNPIKRLFRSSSNVKISDNNTNPGQSFPFAQNLHEQRISPTETVFSSATMDKQNYLLNATLPTIHSPATAASVYHLQTEQQRPTSSHSTRSVFSIFSSAKRRLSIRKSRVFQRQPQAADPTLSISALVGGEVLDSDGVARASAASASLHLPYLGHLPNHLKSPADDLLIEDNSSGQNSEHQQSDCNEDSKSFGYYSVQTLHSQQQTLPTPFYALPALPAACTPPGSSASISVKSPTAFSSKSLGLNALDFGYDEQVVSNLLPSSPGSSEAISLQSSPNSSIGSSIDDDGESSYISQQLHPSIVFKSHPQLMERPSRPAEGSRHRVHSTSSICSNNGQSYVDSQSSMDAVIDLVNISILNEPDNASEIIMPLDSLPTIPSCGSISLVFASDEIANKNPVSSEVPGDQAYDTLDFTKKELAAAEAVDLAASTICLLGSASSVCDKAIEASSAANRSDSNSLLVIVTTSVNADIQSPYAVCDIDELLAELGMAEAQLSGISDEAKSRESIYSQLPHVNLPVGVEPDTFSLQEIDELIEQLESGCQATVDVIGSKVPITGVKGDSFCEMVMSTVHMLGNVGSIAAIVPVSNKPVSPAPMLFDAASLILDLGAIIVPDFIRKPIAHKIESFDAVSPIHRLGAVIEPVLKSKSTVSGLVSIIPLLGRPEDIASVVKHEDLMLQLLDIPDIIANLGGVYVPSLTTSAAVDISVTSMQALFGDASGDLEATTIVSVKEKRIASTGSNCSDSTISSAAWVLAELPNMDVDENISDVGGSRSLNSKYAQHEGAQNIVRLISALNIPPIFVSRPFLGPLRNVLFSHLY
ncbi:hypothetical protein EDC05_003643 [Coemansia umbellata]|nr:hypothetical protein EDC05_003643 [Coemansia umbellata]